MLVAVFELSHEGCFDQLVEPKTVAVDLEPVELLHDDHAVPFRDPL